jgi:hypothetical protein
LVSGASIITTSQASISGFYLRHAAAYTVGGDEAVQLSELFHLGLGVPSDAFAAIA